MGRRAVIAAVSASLVVAAGLLLFSSVEDSDAPSSVQNTNPPGEVSSYWTEERKEEARGG